MDARVKPGMTMKDREPLIRRAARATFSHKGRGEEEPIAPSENHGVIDTGEKSTNQLLGCTKPLIFGLMARGATSWAT